MLDLKQNLEFFNNSWAKNLLTSLKLQVVGIILCIRGWVFMTERTVVNGQFDIIITSKCWGQIVKFFNRLSKTSRKGSLKLEAGWQLLVQNWQKQFGKKKSKYTETRKNSFLFYTQTKYNAEIPFARDRITKFKRTWTSGNYLIPKSTSFYYEDVLHNQKFYTYANKYKSMYLTLKHYISDNTKLMRRNAININIQ